MLLLEDEKKVSELVARALRAERCAVDVAADGQRGWELAAAYDYDLLVGLPCGDLRRPCALRRRGAP